MKRKHGKKGEGLERDTAPKKHRKLGKVQETQEQPVELPNDHVTEEEASPGMYVVSDQQSYRSWVIIKIGRRVLRIKRQKRKTGKSEKRREWLRN
jgi:hypothetical protein